MIKLGIIGYGYWGPNLARNFAQCDAATVAAIGDLRPERLALAKKAHPAAHVTKQFNEIIADPNVDAVAIATPVSTHFTLAMAALKAGKHVLVEKPIASSSDEARRLIDEAARRELVLMVDHTFVYTGAVRKIAALIGNNEIGDVLYYDSVRINLGLFQNDVNVIWDLAVHDLSIMDYVIPSKPRAVSATGISHIADRPENTAYMTIFFDDNVIAHVHVSWLAPVKVRRTLIGGSRKMIIYDDLEPDEKVKIYDKGIQITSHSEDLYRLLVGYRTGDMLSPQLNASEPLQVEVVEFIECIEHKRRPITHGESGLRIVEILEAASKSMALRGAPVELPSCR